MNTTVFVLLCFTSLVAGVLIGLFGQRIWKRYINPPKLKGGYSLSEADTKALDKLSNSLKAYISLELDMPWLSVTLVVCKEKVRRLSVGDKVELSMLSDVNDSVLLIHGNTYNLSTRAEDCVRIEILASEELSGALCLTAKLS